MPEREGMAPVKAFELSSRKVRSVSWLIVGVTVPVRPKSRKRSCTTLPVEQMTPVHVQKSVPVHVGSAVAAFVTPERKEFNTAPSFAAAVTDATA